mmetsp:Transcript_42057/g.130280  ORF Transcript_42057/g.130280 Transcript_42057/m.130280 type:complete len:264 (+) Transcript_42057:305-1096(+)
MQPGQQGAEDPYCAQAPSHALDSHQSQHKHTRSPQPDHSGRDNKPRSRSPTLARARRRAERPRASHFAALTWAAPRHCRLHPGAGCARERPPGGGPPCASSVAVVVEVAEGGLALEEQLLGAGELVAQPRAPLHGLRVLLAGQDAGLQRLFPQGLHVLRDAPGVAAAILQAPHGGGGRRRRASGAARSRGRARRRAVAGRRQEGGRTAAQQRGPIERERHEAGCHEVPARAGSARSGALGGGGHGESLSLGGQGAGGRARSYA